MPRPRGFVHALMSYNPGHGSVKNFLLTILNGGVDLQVGLSIKRYDGVCLVTESIPSCSSFAIRKMANIPDSSASM